MLQPCRILAVLCWTIAILNTFFVVIHGFGIPSSVFKHDNKIAVVSKQQRQPSFVGSIFSTTTTTTRPYRQSFLSAQKKKNDDDDEDDDDDETGDGIGQGPNWIERSLPVGIGAISRGRPAADHDDSDSNSNDSIDDYNLGISGISFETGSLGQRMYDAILSKNLMAAKMSPEIKRALTLCAMDFTAKEATRAALKQNGLDMVLTEAQEDIGMWGQVDSIRLLDPTTIVNQQPFSSVNNKVYDSIDEAVDDWVPGQAFDFVVRQVPAKPRQVDLAELLQALDPDGSLRRSAKDANMTLLDEGGDDDEVESLQALANDSVQRSERAPRAVETAKPYIGQLRQRGYRPIKRSDLLRESINADGTENHKTLMHVMDALVSHGCLVVDVSDGGTSYQRVLAMSKMWQTVESFFTTLQQDASKAESLPAMTSVLDSPYAKVGYATYDQGSMQFLETRWERKTGQLYPTEAAEILGHDGTRALKTAFDLVTDIGKDVVRIATAAASVEHEGFLGADDDEGPSISGIVLSTDDDDDDDEMSSKVMASEAATLLADELADDGKPLTSPDIVHDEGSVSMSPHRICRYTDMATAAAAKKEGKQKQLSSDSSASSSRGQREIFGAHTDSSFVTLVPVAAISGLEVFDEAADKWLRPELLARRHWELEREARGEDPDALFETVTSLLAGSDADDGNQETVLPWHARYVVVMPGEFLQITTRNEVSAAVHRVVAAKGEARLSAPILLRGRPGTKLNVARYLGSNNNHPLLIECDGMSMEQIHQAMQPTSFE